ncbi:MAG: hypothetical protein INF91_04495 [Alphaproteobacteria bacterium]|nr:hypothetical protein [Alphaproteobacteria bacterium]
MVATLISTAVSTALLAVAATVIWREVARNWASIRSALRGEPAHVPYAPAGAPHSLAIRPVRAPRRSVRPVRRQPLALAA